MLKVIQDEQKAAVLQIRCDLPRQRERSDFSKFQSLPNRRVDVAGFMERAQIDEPDSVWERRRHGGRRRQRQSRLPDSSGPGQRQESHGFPEEGRAYRLQFALASDQRRRIRHRGQPSGAGRCGAVRDAPTGVTRPRHSGATRND